MITLKQIRADLREIRFYYINKEKMDEAFQTTGRNEIMNLVEKYHKAMQTAPIKLYDLYVGLYILLYKIKKPRTVVEPFGEVRVNVCSCFVRRGNLFRGWQCGLKCDYTIRFSNTERRI